MTAEIVMALEQAFPDLPEVEGFSAEVAALDAAFKQNVSKLSRDRIRLAVRSALAQC